MPNTGSKKAASKTPSAKKPARKRSGIAVNRTSRKKAAEQGVETEAVNIEIGSLNDAAEKIEAPDLNSIAEPNEPTSRFSWLNWKSGTLIAIVIALLAVAGGLYYVFARTTHSIITSETNTPLVEQLGIILGNDDRPLAGEAEDRINILLLGIGGDGHDGGTLTDSIMVASVKPSTKEVALLSLPRDLVVKIYDDENPNYWEGRKINYAYSLGGMDLAEEKVGEVTGLTMHYSVLVDFSGFKQIIDDIDGVDIDVDQSFNGLYGAQELSIPCPTSQLYYLEDGAYCAVPFERGQQHMDGETALIYSRIRKLSPGSRGSDEGSDFARAQRQQKVLESFKEKLFSAGTLFNPARVNNVLTSVGDHLETNAELWEIYKLMQLAEGVNNESIISRVVDDSENGLVYSKIYEPTGAYVLVPQAGEYNFSEIHALAEHIFENVETVKEDATVQVLNGTSRNGLAAQTAEKLRTYDIDVINVGNAPDETYTKTVIYDLSYGTKSLSLELLQGIVPDNVGTQKDLESVLASDANHEYFDTSADFIIILGEDAYEKN